MTVNFHVTCREHSDAVVLAGTNARIITCNLACVTDSG
jgi:hypothetical protein